MTSPRGWIVVTFVLLVAALPIVRTHQSRVRLQSDTAVARERLRQLGARETENGRLQRQLGDAGADSAEETAQARATLVQLHDEIDQEGRALATAAGIAAAPFSAGSVVPASEWQNAGTATPEAALETALWAGAGGDVDALARLLHLSADSRAAVEKVLARLPPEMRAKYATAERLLAELTVPDVPLGAVRVSGAYFVDAKQTRKTVVIEEYTGPDPKVVPLVFDRGTSGWSLAVPDAVVTAYFAHLASGS